MRKELIIVDFQHDFCEPSGSLYVPGAEKAKENIINAIKSGAYSHIVLTVDWHTIQDKSFKANGGQWPVHCLQYTHGAAIDQDIINAIVDAGISYNVVRKGMNPDVEEYGAFTHRSDKLWHSDTSAYPCVWTAKCENPSNDDAEFTEVTEYDVCGLAGDYCVYKTYQEIKKMPNVMVNPLYDCMAFIGEPFTYEG